MNLAFHITCAMAPTFLMDCNLSLPLVGAGVYIYKQKYPYCTNASSPEQLIDYGESCWNALKIPIVQLYEYLNWPGGKHLAVSALDKEGLHLRAMSSVKAKHLHRFSLADYVCNWTGYRGIGVNVTCKST